MKSILFYILILFLFTSSANGIDCYELTTYSSEEVGLIEKITRSETCKVLSKRVLLNWVKAKESKSDGSIQGPQCFIHKNQNRSLIILFDSFLI